jgi:hypothetical protein
VAAWDGGVGGLEGEGWRDCCEDGEGEEGGGVCGGEGLIGLCGFGLDWEMAFWDGRCFAYDTQDDRPEMLHMEGVYEFRMAEMDSSMRKDTEVAVNSEKKTLVYPRRCAMSKRIFSADRAPIPT